MKAMLSLYSLIAVGTLGVSSAALARSYTPLDPSALQSSTTPGYRPIKPSARASLLGFRPPDVEILLDALARKHPKAIGTSIDKAGLLITRNAYGDSRVRARLRGIHAEALYLKLNPQYGYVAKPNATQNDVYALKADRRPPFNGQIKTHIKSDPAVYAKDMGKDYSSHEFLIPDDHVQPLKDYWTAKSENLKSKGLLNEANAATRKIARVKGLGFTSTELDGSLSRAARYLLRERNAPYVSLGAAIGLAFIPELSSYIQNGTWTSSAASNVTRAAALIATERAATYAIKQAGARHLLGQIKGNAMISVAVLVLDTGFSIYEHGGTAAFRDPRFYTRLGGTTLATGLFFAVDIPVTAGTTELCYLYPPAAPFALLIGKGVGLVTASLASTAGYFGGEAATKSMLERINPDFLRDADNARIATVKEILDLRIRHIQNQN